MREKYRAISSVVGGCNKMREALTGSVLPSTSVADAAEAAAVEAPGSEIEALGKNVAARGADSYKSWRSVRPSAITGPVAYTGICVKRGKVLQQ